MRSWSPLLGIIQRSHWNPQIPAAVHLHLSIFMAPHYSPDRTLCLSTQKVAPLSSFSSSIPSSSPFSSSATSHAVSDYAPAIPSSCCTSPSVSRPNAQDSRSASKDTLTRASSSPISFCSSSLPQFFFKYLLTRSQRRRRLLYARTVYLPVPHIVALSQQSRTRFVA
jgi:hypothetical protein